MKSTSKILYDKKYDKKVNKVIEMLANRKIMEALIVKDFYIMSF